MTSTLSFRDGYTFKIPRRFCDGFLGGMENFMQRFAAYLVKRAVGNAATDM